MMPPPPSLLLSATSPQQQQWLHTVLPHGTPLQYQRVETTTNPLLTIYTSSHYRLQVGHYLLSAASHHTIGLLQVQQVTPTGNHAVIVTAQWLVGTIPAEAITTISWVAGSTLLQANHQQMDTISVNNGTGTELTIPSQAVLGSTLVQSTDKNALTETLVTLLMHWRTLGKFPVVLDLVGVFRQLALPNIALVQLGEQGGTFCSVDAYGLDTLMTDCITQLPSPLQAEAWQQYAAALARVTQPVEDIQTLLALLERAGAGLLHRQLQRLPQLAWFAKQPNARYFSVASWLQQFPTAALWVIDLSALPPTAQPSLIQWLINAILPLAFGKEQLALSVLNQEYQAQATAQVHPTVHAILPFLQGELHKDAAALSIPTTNTPVYDLTIQLQPTEGVMVVQGNTTTHGIPILCGLPAITIEKMGNAEATTPPQPQNQLPEAVQKIVTNSAKPIEIPSISEPPKPVPTENDDDDAWIHVAAQGGIIAATLLEKNAQNRFNSGATAREYLLQEQHQLAEAQQKDTNGLFAPLPASVEEITPQQQTAMGLHANGTAHAKEEALPPLDSLNLPDPPIGHSAEDEAAWLGIDAEHPQAAYFNSILGQMPPHWRQILERELGAATPTATPNTVTPSHHPPTNKKPAIPSTHPAAYPDELPEEPTATQPPQHMAVGELSEALAHNAPLVANPHALHPCLPDDMVAEIESTFSEVTDTTDDEAVFSNHANIPTSHLAHFLEEGLDTTLLPEFDATASTIPAEIPLLEHATIEQDWLEASTARMISENVVPFNFEIIPPTSTEIQPLPEDSTAVASSATMAEATPVETTVELDELDSLPKLEPSPQLAASAQLLQQVFESAPEVTMDAMVLQTAQEQLLGSPVTEHDYEYGNHPNAYPPNTIVPTQPVQPHFVVEQSEHEEAVVLLQEDTSTHATPVVDTHPSADFPMFAFDLADLPTFDLESNNQTPTPAPHQPMATTSTTIPLADELTTPTMVNHHATTAFTVPEQHTVAPPPPAETIPVNSSTTAPAVETNWQALTQQLEALNNTSSVTQSPAMATNPSPSIANTTTIPAVAPAPTPIAQNVPPHNQHHATSLHKLSVGLRVQHQEYGLGTVQAVVPLEDRNIASILFDTHGRKLLDPALSALYPA